MESTNQTFAVGVVWDGDEEWPTDAQHFPSMAAALEYVTARGDLWPADQVRIYASNVDDDRDYFVALALDTREDAIIAYGKELDR